MVFDTKGRESALYPKRTVLGVGVYDSTEPTRVSGKMRPAYQTWANIIERCYSQSYHNGKPSYVGCTVCDEWLTYSNFETWFNENYREGWHLDKDIINSESRVYCPEWCLFIPSWVNTFVSTGRHGKSLMGVYEHLDGRPKKYQAHCRNPFTKKNERLGSFYTDLEAHEAWKKRKIEHVETMRNQLDEIDLRLYPALLNRYKDF